MPIKKRKNENFEKKKRCFFLMSRGTLDPKIRFLCQKVCSVVRVQTDGQTHRQTDTKVNTQDILSSRERDLNYHFGS